MVALVDIGWRNAPDRAQQGDGSGDSDDPSLFLIIELKQFHETDNVFAWYLRRLRYSMMLLLGRGGITVHVIGFGWLKRNAIIFRHYIIWFCKFRLLLALSNMKLGLNKGLISYWTGLLVA